MTEPEPAGMPPPSTTEVHARLEYIRSLAHDPEAAHVAEDQLYLDVLETIAAGEVDDPAELAREALRALYIDFERWAA